MAFTMPGYDCIALICGQHTLRIENSSVFCLHSIGTVGLGLNIQEIGTINEYSLNTESLTKNDHPDLNLSKC